MNEYRNLKKAMERYLIANEDLLQKAVDNGNYEEAEKRERRIYAILKCKSIMKDAK